MYYFLGGRQGVLHPVHQGVAPQGGARGRDGRDERELHGRREYAPAGKWSLSLDQNHKTSIYGFCSRFHGHAGDFKYGYKHI